MWFHSGNCHSTHSKLLKRLQTFSQGFIHLRLWPTSSPNFNALNYYLRGKQINRFYVNNLRFAKAENNIQTETADISGPDLDHVKRNIFRRCETYLGAGGSHGDTVQWDNDQFNYRGRTQDSWHALPYSGTLIRDTNVCVCVCVCVHMHTHVHMPVFIFFIS